MNVDKLCMGCMNELNSESSRFCPKCGYETNNQNPSRGLQPRTILNGKYLVGKVIGEGGFGITYIGYDLILNSRIAIKEYFPVELASRDTSTGIQTFLSVFTGSKEDQYKKGMERFVNEASNLAKFYLLPGIVAVRDFFYENNTAYMVMEYIDGITLAEYLKQNGEKLPYRTVLSMMQPVMDSLQKVHEAGIIHRDICPDNIMVTKDGTVKLIDFGAARLVGNEDHKSLTVILKHGYSPEEQYQTNGKQGLWTDVYALAATMYRMITGIVPQEATERVLSGDNVLPVNKIISDVPRHVSDAIAHGMGVKITDRSSSMEVFSAELKGKSRYKKNHLLVPLIAAGILTCVLAIVLWLIIGGNKDNEKAASESMSEQKESAERDITDDTEKDKSGQVEQTSEAKGAEDETYDPAADEEAKERMLESIRQKSGGDISAYEYNDFNADGIYEVFACVCKQNDNGNLSPEEFCEIWKADPKSMELADVIEDVPQIVETQVIQYGRNKHFIVLADNYYEAADYPDMYIYALSENDKISRALELHTFGGECKVKDGKTYISSECVWIWENLSYTVDYEVFFLNDKYYTYDAVKVPLEYVKTICDFDGMIKSIEPKVIEFSENDEYYRGKKCLVLKNMWLDENDVLYLNAEAWDSTSQYRKNESTDPYDFNRPNVELFYIMLDISDHEDPRLMEICEGNWKFPEYWLNIHENREIESLRNSLGAFNDEDHIIMGDSDDAGITMTAEELKAAIEEIRVYYYTPSALDIKKTSSLTINGKTYTLELYYHDNKLCFAFAFDKNEEHRLYFKYDQMIRYIDENGNIYDLGNLDSFRSWENTVLEIAYE